MINKFKKKDWILLLLIILFIIIAAIFFYTFRVPGKFIRVSKNNEVIDELNLNQDLEKTYNFSDEENILVIRNGSADIISANCPNQICVNSSPISNVGETIACLPHGLIFEVVQK